MRSEFRKVRGKHMKRITSWLFIITLTFVLGVTSTTFLYLKFTTSNIQKSGTLQTPNSLKNEDVTLDLLILSFCELSNNLEQYNEKIVRISATIQFGLEGSWFSDPNCGISDNIAIVSYKNEELYNPIAQARKQKNMKFLANELDVVVIGKFKNEVYKDCCLIAPFQFEISQVEKVSKPN